MDPPQVTDHDMIENVLSAVLESEGVVHTETSLELGRSDQPTAAGRRKRAPLSSPELQKVQETLEQACLQVATSHGSLIRSDINKLDWTDSGICPTFFQVLETVEKKGGASVSWGKIVSIITFTGLLSAELRKKGEEHKCEHLHTWLIGYFNRRPVSTWIRRQEGGWTNAIKSLKLEPTTTRASTSPSSISMQGAIFSGVATLAAVGLVGALLAKRYTS